MGFRPRPLNVADGAKGHGSDEDWKAPQLAKALLEAPAGQDELLKSELDKRPKDRRVTPQSLDADLKALLQHVQDRMYWGFNEAWFSTQGYAAWPAPDQIKADLEAAKKEKEGDAANAKVREALKKCGDIMAFWNDPEEQWARAFAEMVVFSPYAGIGVTYYSKESKDPDLFKLFPKISLIPLACQHLSTLCILSRGFSMGEIGNNGCSCGAAVAKFKAFGRGFIVNYKPETNQSRPEEEKRGPEGIQEQYSGGAKVDGKKAAAGGSDANSAPSPTSPLNTVEGLLQVKITPGSVVAFNGGGPHFSRQNYPSGITHIASVLRVTATRVQFIDTGVMAGGGEGGTQDHGFRGAGAIGSPAADTVAVGVLKPPAKSLDAAAEEMGKAKPLGLIRLVVLDTSQAGAPVVRFVSKLLHMRRPISYLVWSLRGLPVSGLSLIWYVYLPNGTGTDTLVGALSQDGWPKQTPAALYPNGTPLSLWCVIRGNDQGGATVFRRKSYSHPEKEADGKTNKLDGSGNPIWTTDAVWYQDLGLTTYPDKSGERGAENFRGPAALSVKMEAPASGTLESWCKTTFGKCYLRRTTTANGNAGASVEDFESGVGFFDR